VISSTSHEYFTFNLCQS